MIQIDDKTLKAVIRKCKKAVKENKGKEGNTFLCSGSVSELIANMKVMKELGGGDLYIRISGKPLENDFYADMHEMLTFMTTTIEPAHFDMDTYDYYKPLLEAQPYVKSVNVYEGNEVTFNLDMFRYCFFNESCSDKTMGILLNAINETWGLKISFSEPWISVDGEANPDRRILVARSLKYHGGDMCYTMLNTLLKSSAFFFGTDQEYMNFIVCCDLLWRLRPENVIELAECVKGMKIVMTNECPIYWLALALGAEQIHYELCPDFYYGITDNPNVQYFLGLTYVKPDVTFPTVKKSKRKKNV